MLIFIAALAASSLACVQTARTGGESGGAAVLKTFGIPPNLPPTPSPTPPPPPPPFQVGWVAREGAKAVNQMTRQNCKKSVEFIAPDTGAAEVDRDLLQETFIYQCEYNMYIEVDLFETQGRTGCACGLSWGRQAPPQDPNYEPTFATQISKFTLQVYHTQRETPIGRIEGFDNLNPNPTATDNLNQQLNRALEDSFTMVNDEGNRRTFENAREVFTGFVTTNATGGGFSREAIPLLRDEPENAYHVPVMCFKVLDVYQTAYRWPEPPKPVLSSPPNAYVTNCVPFVPSAFVGAGGGSARKRWHTFGLTMLSPDQTTKYAGVSYWFRDYLLFAVQVSAGVSQGWAPQSRYMTSYYASSDCNHLAGVVTFDRQFTTSKLERNTALFGGFNWERTFDQNGYTVFGGVPQSIIQNRYARVGFHTVSWRENFARDLSSGGDGAFRPGILFHFLNGTFINSDATGEPAFEALDGVNGGLPIGWERNPGLSSAEKTAVSPHRYKLCETVPEGFKGPVCDKTTALGGSNCPYLDNRYLESAYHFPATNALSCAEQGAFQKCARDVTYLSFQNLGEGALSRDFSKKSNSLLLTGPRDLFCQDILQVGSDSFDALTYKPIKATNSLMKRSAGGDQFLTSEDMKRQPSNLNFDTDFGTYDIKPNLPLYGRPEQEAIIVNAAGGSYDVAENTAGGSHPIALFEETYTVPLSLDPDDPEYDTAQDGYLFDNTFSACLQGTKGCNCRDRAGRRACDAPLTCNEEKFCVDPPCVAGEAGCDCVAPSNTCSGDLKCNTKTLTCVYDETCPFGAVGCACRTGAAATQCDSGSSCVEGLCLQTDCPAGLPGCACYTDVDNPTPMCFVQDSNCDSQTNLCVGGTIEGQSVTTLKVAGGNCQVLADCQNDPEATCNTDIASGVCVIAPCAPGSTGCRCDAGTCASAADECDPSGFCLTSSCEHGTKGCMCLFGFSCEAGFECYDTVTDVRRLSRLPIGFSGARVDRCVKTRCPKGQNGCPCDSDCAGRGFECKVMDKATLEKRCVATGRECGGQTLRCQSFCGKGNVVRCPGCSDQIPICKVPGSASMQILAPAALLVLLAAIFVELF